jgi:hypothetical protein
VVMTELTPYRRRPLGWGPLRRCLVREECTMGQTHGGCVKSLACVVKESGLLPEEGSGPGRGLGSA